MKNLTNFWWKPVWISLWDDVWEISAKTFIHTINDYCFHLKLFSSLLSTQSPFAHFYLPSSLAWENGQHFATPPLASLRDDVWEMSSNIFILLTCYYGSREYFWLDEPNFQSLSIHYPDLGKCCIINVEFLHLLLKRLISRGNWGCFLKLLCVQDILLNQYQFTASFTAYIRVLKSSWLPAKIPTYLVSIDWLLCLTFLYRWRFLNKISLDWPHTWQLSRLLENFLTTLI